MVLTMVLVLSVDTCSTMTVLMLKSVIVSVMSAWNVSIMSLLGPGIVVVRSTCDVVAVTTVTTVVDQDCLTSTHRRVALRIEQMRSVTLTGIAPVASACHGATKKVVCVVIDGAAAEAPLAGASCV